MFSLLTYIFIIPVVGSFFYLNGHYIVKNTVMIKWEKFRKINHLVATNYKGIVTIIWISLCMVVQALWISIIQYMNNTIVPIKGGKYKVTYVINGKTYKMIVKPARGPRKVLLVSDDTSEDISYTIFPYLGPEENFHGKVYTPRFFEYNELIFEMSNGDEKIFKIDDDIILKN